RYTPPRPPALAHPGIPPRKTKGVIATRAPTVIPQLHSFFHYGYRLGIPAHLLVDIAQGIVCPATSRIQFSCPRQAPLGFLVISGSVKHSSEMLLDSRGQRVEPFGDLYLTDRFGVTAQRRQQIGEVLMRVQEARIERDGTLVLLFRASPVPVVTHFYIGEGGLCLGASGVQLNCPRRGPSRRRFDFSKTSFALDAALVPGNGKPGPGGRVFPIKLNGTLEVADGAHQVFFVEP